LLELHKLRTALWLRVLESRVGDREDFGSEEREGSRDIDSY